ncbi:GNAT superfamily N-acetyltransferase [Actinoplanes octamycinicus]|uniref:GNAT superfamily N-acetyltransferase n=1 Tax=Actinoplanes octamycinicus TaxID=135948 RepID=A0A7W7H516_9ACTN|nr:GNAT family N-acetyltransferase [Actinoplanes octamycinicus]MBB4743939.1 GNAT superfamily N-acetyltransferase [Actinoplanes octamycinicus]GIE58564.1 N-acetyltransferase [Actinoplanes octamycinicus]
MAPTDIATRIRRATSQDTTKIARILAAAFLDGDLADWLEPDRTVRRRIYPDYFTMLAEHATAHGHVHLIDQGAAAVWYDITDQPIAPITDYDQRLAAITGTALPRFQALDEAMRRHHPHGRPHTYLALIAVRPGEQGHRLGSTLLQHQHSQLDQQHRPAYLEATGQRNSALYQRYGYERLTPYPIVPGGPNLYPMWRPPT